MQRFAVVALLALLAPQLGAAAQTPREALLEQHAAAPGHLRASGAKVLLQQPEEEEVDDLAQDVDGASAFNAEGDSEGGEEDALDDDEEDAAETTADDMTGSDIDDVVAMEAKEGTETVDQETQREAADLEITEDDEENDEDDDNDDDDDEDQDEVESAEDPMSE
mmetsp:Transcript_29434/g.77848  ORF Transcript_29434/g.77848 Transcript_29434/m.77848 type:complete len:165 (-) Transcript_29434:30-524(-)